MLLKDHLKVVGENARKTLEEHGVTDPKLLETAEIIGKVHDFGKYTHYFQAKLEGKKYSREMTQHSMLSAIFGAWLVNRRLRDDFLTFSSLVTIRYHHGGLDFAFPEDQWSDTYGVKEFLKSYAFKKQAESISRCISQINDELTEIGIPELRDFVQDLTSVRNFEFIRKAADIVVSNIHGLDPFERLYTLLLLFSALIYADKSEAGHVDKPERKYVPSSLVDNHRPVSTCSSYLEEIRKQVFREATSTVEEFLKAGKLPHVLKITAPTGSGKTATAIAVALRIRRYVEETYGYRPRIIYCLPFINIIEQTYDVIRRILIEGGIEASHSTLIKHHHLYPAKLEYNEEENVEKKLFAFDAWDSEIIVTTFVQLFETMMGTSNRMLLKMHKLFGSIIILDEIQAIAMEYWALIRKALESLSKYSWLILMSATSPSMLAPSNSVELIRSYTAFYRGLNRVKFHYIPQDFPPERVVALVLNELSKDDIKSIAVVTNTIRTSIQIYDKLKGSIHNCVPLTGIDGEQILKNEDNIVICYLSTNIIPRERGQRIKILKSLLELKRPIVVVCTQVIEAGVDLDFDVVVRDLAPLDSIVQAAGRCNRNARKSSGDVYIVKLVDSDGNPSYPFVYGKLAVEKVTIPLLSEAFDEASILGMVREYFDRVREIKVLDHSVQSEKILQDVKDFNLRGVRDFHIIQELPKVSIFIEVDSDASSALETFRANWLERRRVGSLEDHFKVKARIRESRISLEDFIVETWDDNAAPKETIVDDIDIRYIKKEHILDYYDPETGIRRSNGLQAAIW